MPHSNFTSTIRRELRFLAKFIRSIPRRYANARRDYAIMEEGDIRERLNQIYGEPGVSNLDPELEAAALTDLTEGDW